MRASAEKGVAPSRNELTIYPAPEGEILSTDYAVEVNGRPVPVYAIQSRWHDKKYSAAYFDFSGTVTVKIKINFPGTQSLPSLDRFAPGPHGGQEQNNRNPTTFQHADEERKCEKLWTLPAIQPAHRSVQFSFTNWILKSAIPEGQITVIRELRL